MNVLLIPPHGDFSLSWSAPPGFQVLDVGRRFVERIALEAITGPDALAAVEQRAKAQPSRLAKSLLQARAAAALLSAPRGLQTHLRALGGLLSACSKDGPVELELDDIHLAAGTTERSMDALHAAQTPGALYERDLDAAVTACADAPVVRIRLDKDQQLPSVLFLANALQPKRGVQITGTFATRHEAALRKCSALATCDFVSQNEPPTLTGVPGLAFSEPHLTWRDRATPLPSSAWAGFASLGELATGTLSRSDCRLAVIPFALGAEAWVGVDGATVEPSELQARTKEFKDKGGRVLGEWWLGAPGVGRDRLLQSADALASGGVLDGVACFRPFHWPLSAPQPLWGETPVELLSSDADRDLARGRRFSAPGTPTAAEIAELAPALAGKLGRQSQPIAGKLAQAYASIPEASAPPSMLRLDPDCAVVPLPFSLEGEPVDTTYAFNFRTGWIAKMDRRLAQELAQLTACGPAAFFARAPEAQRQALTQMLKQKSVLSGASP